MSYGLEYVLKKEQVYKNFKNTLKIMVNYIINLVYNEKKTT